MVLALACLGLAVPLLPAIGTPVFWGLLPFEIGALGLLWIGFSRSNRDGALSEILTLWRDEMRVERREPSGRVLRWRADPYWVRLSLHPEGRKVENYLTLRGSGREIELGAFLSPDERSEVKEELEAALGQIR